MSMDLFFAVILGVLLFEVSYLVTVSTKKILKNINKKTIMVDTSVLIDGRIVPVVKSGFLFGDLLIPRCVISELQFMADNADSNKRSRARHGLDIVTELQNIDNLSVEILRDDSFSGEEVDDQLLKLANKYSSSILTIDYNLNKVAQVENIEVLNINDLAMNLRMSYLPGEKSIIELIGKGQEPHQAVGHLADGTMVVVENASSKIGQFTEVEFIRSLQTAAGKMLFAKTVDNDKIQKSRHSKNIPQATSRVKKFRTPENNNNNRKSQSGQRKRIPNKKYDPEQKLIDLANR